MAGLTVEKTKTALYCRLSKDDGTFGESSSIQSQKDILSRYAKEHGFGNTEFYVDDGYSGTNFNRPAFQRLLTDIENGEVSTAIAKDLSRLGRNYLETGVFLEVYFPEHHVRFIAINDGVDTIRTETVDYTPFRNIANEFYARDTSKKVRSAIKTRVLSGMYLGTSAPYGYRKDPSDHHRLLIDERYAPNVRMIFDMALDGKGISAIRKIMNEKHILRPAAVNENGFERFFDGEDDPNRYEWSNNSVRGILRNPVYAGNVVTGKRLRPSFKSKKTFSVLPENYTVVPAGHEPIISQEKFDLVQKLITSRRNPGKKSRSWDNIFAGLVKCEDCGYAMTLTKAHRNPRENPIDEYGFLCNNYKAFGKDKCSSHWIEARTLYESVLEDIRTHARAAIVDDRKMVEELLGKIGADQKKQSRVQVKELKEKKSRLAEVDRLFQRLYEDRVNGAISDRNYQMMSGRYEEEQTQLQERIKELSASVSESAGKAESVEQFTRLVRDYAGIEVLDAALLHTLVEKITIGEPKPDGDGGKVQEIRIYYKFIGHIS